MTDVLEELLEYEESIRADLRAKRKDNDLAESYKRFHSMLAQYWRMQSQDFMKLFSGIFTEARWSRIRLDRAWQNAAERANNRLIRQVKKELAENIRAGAASSINDVKVAHVYGVGFDKASPAVRGYINDRAEDLAKELTRTSQKRLSNLITRLDDAGLSKNQIGKAVREEIRTWHNAPAGVMSRAEMVSITESGEAYEFGRDQVTSELARAGVRLEKRWILVLDNFTCRICEEAVVDDWLPSTVSFSNGFSRPLAHPACRCDIEIRVAE